MAYIKCAICNQEFCDSASICPNCSSSVKEQFKVQSGFKSCSLCKMNIPNEANICHHCGQHQKLAKRLLFSNVYNPISIVLLIISIGMLIISNQEKISARNALKEAQIAATQAKNAREISIEVLEVIKNLVEIHNPKAAAVTLNYSPIADHKEVLLDKINKVLKTSEIPPGK